MYAEEIIHLEKENCEVLEGKPEEQVQGLGLWEKTEILQLLKKDKRLNMSVQTGGS